MAVTHPVGHDHRTYPRGGHKELHDDEANDGTAPHAAVPAADVVEEAAEEDRGDHLSTPIEYVVEPLCLATGTWSGRVADAVMRVVAKQSSQAESQTP